MDLAAALQQLRADRKAGLITQDELLDARLRLLERRGGARPFDGDDRRRTTAEPRPG